MLRRLLPLLFLWAGAAAQEDDARKSIEFTRDFDAPCVQREGHMVLVRNTHPSRGLRVWLERYHMGQPTGDRSRSDLAVGGEPERLGCSRTDYGPQEWRILRAEFVDQPQTGKP